MILNNWITVYPSNREVPVSRNPLTTNQGQTITFKSGCLLFLHDGMQGETFRFLNGRRKQSESQTRWPPTCRELLLRQHPPARGSRPGWPPEALLGNCSGEVCSRLHGLRKNLGFSVASTKSLLESCTPLHFFSVLTEQ